MAAATPTAFNASPALFDDRCFPLSRASDCLCPVPEVARTNQLPLCVPSPHCGRALSPLPSKLNVKGKSYVQMIDHLPQQGERQPLTVASSSAAYVVAFDFNETRVRCWYRHDPFESYAASMHLIMRLVLSLERVGSKLPLVLLASGAHDDAYEEKLTKRNVLIKRGGHRIKTPGWANAFHVGSFSKLAVRAREKEQSTSPAPRTPCRLCGKARVFFARQTRLALKSRPMHPRKTCRERY
uniref:Uncharacterized protein n=1 Tax=Chrysotila carterae TaxID=13221 RepID=A0A7S4BII4_CHRCT